MKMNEERDSESKIGSQRNIESETIMFCSYGFCYGSYMRSSTTYWLYLETVQTQKCYYLQNAIALNCFCEEIQQKKMKTDELNEW